MRNVGVRCGLSRKTVAQAGHTAPITSVEWSPDGRLLATGSYDGSVLVWNSSGRQILHSFFHSRLVNHVRWDPSGQYLASASADFTCRIWDVLNERCEAVLARHPDDVYTLAWSPDGHRLITVSEDGTGHMWDLSKRLPEDTRFFHESHLHSVDWNPRADLIATCGEDSAVRLWNPSGELLGDWHQPRDLETCRWSQAGDVLAAACDDGWARILNTAGETVTQLGPARTSAKSVAWSPDGRHLAVGSYDATCTIWEVTSGRALVRLEGSRLWPRSVSWNPVDSSVAISTLDREPVIAHIDPGTSAGNARRPTALLRPRTPTTGINALAVTKAGILLASDDGAVYSWSPSSRDSALVAAAGARGAYSLINTIAWNSTARMLAFGTFDGNLVICTPGSSSIYDEKPLATPINQVAWSSEGQLAVATYDGPTLIFRVKPDGLHLISELSAHEVAVKGIAWLAQFDACHSAHRWPPQDHIHGRQHAPHPAGPWEPGERGGCVPRHSTVASCDRFT